MKAIWVTAATVGGIIGSITFLRFQEIGLNYMAMIMGFFNEKFTLDKSQLYIAIQEIFIFYTYHD